MQIEDLYTGGYLTKSKINLNLATITQYRKLLLEYDPELKAEIDNHNPQFLNSAVFIMDV